MIYSYSFLGMKRRRDGKSENAIARPCSFPRLDVICLGKRYILKVWRHIYTKETATQNSLSMPPLLSNRVSGNIYIYFSDHTVEQLLGLIK